MHAMASTFNWKRFKKVAQNFYEFGCNPFVPYESIFKKKLELIWNKGVLFNLRITL